jgi:DNA-binding NarL/FixJ family response regulator
MDNNIESLKIILADDHPIVLKGLELFLLQNNFSIIKSLTNGIECYNSVLSLKPDIAIIDYEMPGMSGIEIAKKIKQFNISTKIIIITTHKDEAIYEQANLYDVKGYILKEFAIEEIINCINIVANGEKYISKGIYNYLLKSINRNSVIEQLSLSEQKIIKLIAQNKTSVQIAEILFISLKTVENQRSNISKKLNLQSQKISLLDWVSKNKSLF